MRVFPVALANLTDGVTVERHAGASSRLKIDNGSYQANALTAAAATSLELGSAAEPASFRLYGTAMFNGAGLTDPQIAQLVTYMGAKQGRAL